jgi:hypothetical protein
VCAKSTNWEDMVQDDNRRVYGIPFLGNLYITSLSISISISISMKILVLNMSILLKTSRDLV